MPYKQGERRAPTDVPRTFITDTAAALAFVRDVLPAAVKVAGDTETLRQDVIDEMTAQLRVFSIATRHIVDGVEVDHSWLVDLRDVDKRAFGRAIAQVGAGMPHGKVFMYGWNAGFDDPVTSVNLGGATREDFRELIEWEDLMFYEGALNQGAAGYTWYISLADASRKYLGWELEGKGTVQLSYDLTSDLTAEQQLYAHLDGVVTLWLSDVLDERVDAAGLRETASDLECRARAFLKQMQIHGYPFDKDGWLANVAAKSARATQVLSELAEMTGSGQPELFSDSITPTWNPDSPVDVKRILNTLAADRVRAHFARAEGGDGQPRLLGPADSVDKSALMSIGGPLCDLLLEYSKLAKVDSTYGAKMMGLLGPDGRFHAEYTQTVVATGRASSRNPNAQNLHPEMKNHIQPGPWWRVLVAGDYSQAELRGMAQLTGEEAIIAAYAAGKDLHEDTASRMFTDVDLADLKRRGENDPEAASLFEKTRGKAKSVNFGMPYGLRAKGLAQQMRDKGIDMTAAEAEQLLAQWAVANPATAGWLDQRDAYIAGVASNPPACDWHATWRLFRMTRAVAAAASELRKAGNKKPSAEELVEQMTPRSSVEDTLAAQLGRPATETEVQTEVERRIAAVEWTRSFLAPVVLLADGTPFQLESRTWAERRRLFQVSAYKWIDAMVMIAAREPKAGALVDSWTQANRRPALATVDARGKRTPLSKELIRKAFEGENAVESKVSFVTAMLEGAGRAGAENLMRRALADQIRGIANAYRNAPIQGGVADAVLRSFGMLHRRLAAFPGAFPVMTVHDSIVIECDARDALAVRELMKSTMEEAMAYYCSKVVVVADVEVHRNLSKKGRLTDAQVGELAVRADAELGVGARPVTYEQAAAPAAADGPADGALAEAA